MKEAESLETLRAQLDALRQEQQGFTDTVTHDLRAPLRHITAYAQLVREEAAGSLSLECRGFVDTIMDSAQLLNHQLDALAAYARLAAVGVQPQALALGELVLEVVRQLDAAAAAASSPPVRWDVASQLPVVHADAALLRQALLHVLGNAVFFSQGQAEAVVAVSATPESSGTRCSVLIRDSGIGCDLSHSDRLFSVFARLHSPKQLQALCAQWPREAAGTRGLGMGLASARRIVQRLGGNVVLQSSPGAGCNVWLHLPLAKAG